MDSKCFPGQQTGERILYFARSHPIAKYAFFTKAVFFATLLFTAFWFLANNIPPLALPFRLFGAVLWVLTVFISFWWGNSTYDQTGIYITDRRVVRFSALAPFTKTTRALFWDEAVKCKTYRHHPFLDRILGIGSLEIHARTQDKDNVDFDGLTYHEDLANYIDKILFTYKNRPSELSLFRPFVAKPKGQRD